MQGRKIFRAVRPFISAIAVMATAAALVFTIYFTQMGLEWTTFLTGILVAATLAEATSLSRSEWIVARRTAQLLSAKTRLERETRLLKKAEAEIADGKPILHLVDEVLPTMVALFDTAGRCRYHNRAFKEWLRLRPEQINGCHLRAVFGVQVHQEIATAVRQALDGQTIHYGRTQKMPDGAVYRLSVEHLPQFGEDGKITGFYMLITDITSPSDMRMSARLESVAPERADAPDSLRDGVADQNMFIQSFSEQITGHSDAAGRIIAAIERGEFRLFCQLITPLAINSGETEHYEILVRLMEEEESMMPPGEFFPLAEKHGLMPYLDRWVVQHVTEWVACRNPQGRAQGSSIFFINVSSATLSDSGFPEFLQQTLLKYGVPGAALCFEVTGTELAMKSADVAEFARRVRLCGCHVALSGFGREQILFDLIRGFRVDFLKIDGNVVLYILRDPVYLARVAAIDRVAKKIGVKTIAEMVESEEIIVRLREIGIDFAQGFGISRPRPLEE